MLLFLEGRPLKLNSSGSTSMYHQLTPGVCVVFLVEHRRGYLDGSNRLGNIARVARGVDNIDY